MLGCLLGGALGYQVEFSPRAAIEQSFGRQAPARLAYGGGALAESLDVEDYPPR